MASSGYTAAGGGAVAGVALVLGWVLAGCPRPVPNDVVYIIAVGAAWFAHWLANVIAPWIAYLSPPAKPAPHEEPPK